MWGISAGLSEAGAAIPPQPVSRLNAITKITRIKRALHIDYPPENSGFIERGKLPVFSQYRPELTINPLLMNVKIEADHQIERYSGFIDYQIRLTFHSSLASSSPEIRLR
jgi:hypothetical protein